MKGNTLLWLLLGGALIYFLLASKKGGALLGQSQTAAPTAGQTPTPTGANDWLSIVREGIDVAFGIAKQVGQPAPKTN